MGKVKGSDDRSEWKKTRQGVVGLCRVSDIHYKREKKWIPVHIFPLNAKSLCTAANITHATAYDALRGHAFEPENEDAMYGPICL
jgi:hypothetical protein